MRLTLVKLPRHYVRDIVVFVDVNLSPKCEFLFDDHQLIYDDGSSGFKYSESNLFKCDEVVEL
jgi:hypothetical protein